MLIFLMAMIILACLLSIFALTLAIRYYDHGEYRRARKLHDISSAGVWTISALLLFTAIWLAASHWG